MSTMIVANAFDAHGVEPSAITSEDGRSSSFTKPVLDDGVTRMGIWIAEPGTFVHAGNPTGETFVVLEGEATIDIDGAGSHELFSGQIINVPPATASTMTVRSTLRKFAVTRSAGS